MKKSNFVSMILGTVGGIFFALGMCMCLLPQWDAAAPGVAFGAVGAVILIAMLIIRRRMEGKEPIKLNAKTVGGIVIGIIGALLLGLGMCMTMIWNHLIFGIIVGLIGIIALLCLIPYVKGLK